MTLGGADPNFQGGTTIRQGILAASNSLALGPSTGGQVQVFSGATLRLTNNVDVNKPISLDGVGALGSLGALGSFSGNNTLSGNVNLADPSVRPATATVSTIIQGAAGVNEVQTVNVSGGAGIFTLTFNGQTTAALSLSATPAQVQTALNALS